MRRRSEWTGEEIDAYTVAHFASDNLARARALLESYGVESYEREVPQVRRALVQAASGDIARLRMLVTMAKNDYRDLLVRDEGRSL